MRKSAVRERIESEAERFPVAGDFSGQAIFSGDFALTGGQLLRGLRHVKRKHAHPMILSTTPSPLFAGRNNRTCGCMGRRSWAVRPVSVVVAVASLA